MAVKIRLARRGRKKTPFYHIVVADSRSPRDGKYIETIGSYNPMTRPATISLDREKAYEWILKGAQPTETARAILRFKGILYKKHLQRGVLKGAMTQEEADSKFEEYVNTKEAKIAARFEQTLKEKMELNKKVSGSPVKKQEIVTEDHSAQDKFAETTEQATDSQEAVAISPDSSAVAVEEVAEATVASAEAAEEVNEVAEIKLETETAELASTANEEMNSEEE